MFGEQSVCEAFYHANQNNNNKNRTSTYAKKLYFQREIKVQ